MTNFGWSWVGVLFIVILSCIVLMQHAMITEITIRSSHFEEKYRLERAIADVAVARAAACINARKRYINVGGGTDG